MKKLSPKAVIFDMDGVIVDSMPYHFLAWYEALRPYGVRVSCFDVYAKEGERWSQSLKDFLKKEGITPAKKLLSEIFVFRQKIFKKYFKRFIFKDAEPVLRSLKKRGYLLALVTGTPDYEVERILPKKLYRIFDNIVAGNNVKKGKPHPEPYLKAAKMLKVNPDECIVVENAPYGIESAKRAEMYCVAVSTSLPKEFLRGADLVVDKLREITKFINI
ncbi:MAG: HAD family phosphatase [Candidatus Omnitrophica bacterium]|jgi:beta-phosphoglucomutase|nr:HAD family phosphatase [Candidatus Omnitrophota bacterium]